MSLSEQLLNEFAKVVNTKPKTSKETTVHGTVKRVDGDTVYVSLDGSDALTPVASTTEVKEGERVNVLIKNHQAILNGNTSSPSASTGTVQIINNNVEVIGQEVDEVIENLTAINAKIDNLDVGDLTAVNAEITNLKAKDVEIEGSLTAINAKIDNLDVGDLTAVNAEITNLKAKDAEIEGSLTAINAKIDNLDVGNLEATYAKITDLEATNAEITNLKTDKLSANELSAEVAKLGYATVDSLNATNAEITKLKSNQITTEYLEAEYAKITNLEVVNQKVTNLEATNLDVLDRLSAVELDVETLEANQITTTYLEANYADIRLSNIDTANIDVANIGLLFANVGLIDRATIVDGHVTGFLDAVEINANKITAGTLIADRLLLRGSAQSILYQLNSLSRNLLPYPYYHGSSRVVNGITTTIDENGWAYVKGTASDAANLYDFTFRDVEFPAGTYTLSGIPEDASDSTHRVWLGIYKSGTTTEIMSTKVYGDGLTFTIDEPFTMIFRIGISAGTTVDVVYKPMLCKGTEAKPFEPYRERTQALTSETINGEVLTDRTINADKIIAGSITSNEIHVAELFANEAAIATLVSQQIFANAIATNSIVVGASDKATEALTVANTANTNASNAVTTANTAKTNASNAVTTANTASTNASNAVTTANAAKTNASNAVTTANTANTNASNAVTTANTASANATNALNRATYHYGTCSTAAGTAAKVVTLSGFSLYTGAQVTVQFTNANTAANPTLNVNSTGAKSIRVNNANITSKYYWKANNTVTFVYNGTYWVMADSSANTALANWMSSSDVTYIDGGKIYTHSITADRIAADAIKSQNYSKNSEGSFLNLADGSFDSKHLKWTPEGYLSCTAGTIGGFDLDADSFRYEESWPYKNTSGVSMEAYFYSSGLKPDTWATDNDGKIFWIGAHPFINGSGINSDNFYEDDALEYPFYVTGYGELHSSSLVVENGNLMNDPKSLVFKYIQSTPNVTSNNTVNYVHETIECGSIVPQETGNILCTGKWVFSNASITTSGSISTSLKTDSFLKGNQGVAIINSTAAAGGYVALSKLNSTNGYFTEAVHSNQWIFNYTAKTKVTNNENNVTYKVILLDESGNSTFPLHLTTGGNLTAGNTSASAEKNVRVVNKYGSAKVLIDTSGTKGLYDITNSKWILQCNSAGDKITLGDSTTAIVTNKTLSVSSTTFGMLILDRSGSANASAIRFSNSNGTLGYIGMTGAADGGLRRWLADGSTGYTLLDTNNYASYTVPKSGGTFTGTLILSKTQDASGTADQAPALIVGGTRTAAHLEMDANEIMAKANGTTTAPLYINSDGGDVYIGSNATVNAIVNGPAKATDFINKATGLSIMPIMGGNNVSGYIRFPNIKMQICWLKYSPTSSAISIATAWGSIYTGTIRTLPNWPVQFSAQPVVIKQGVCYGSSGEAGVITETVGDATTKAPGKASVVRGTTLTPSNGASYQDYYYAIAIGPYT